MFEYGNKYNNIIKLYNCQEFQEYVPNAYPFRIEEDDERFIEELIKNECEETDAILESLLYDKYGTLFESVDNELGALPWIIRSSGDEDREDNPNAGAYESYICNSKEEFQHKLAKTMLSGMIDRATQQGVFVDKNYIRKLIPVFIQKLINCDDKDEKEHVPFIAEHVTYEMVELMAKIHDLMELKQLDTEWVIETNHGIVSGTSMSIKNGERITAEISLGFGIGATQHCTSKNINRIKVTSDGVIKYQKQIYENVDVKKIWIIQAREAHNLILKKRVPLLKESFCLAIRKKDAAITWNYDDEIIIGEVFKIANVIIANTLMQAWDIYLHFSEEQREKIAYVIVGIGSKTEHAGIMFSQTGVTVVKCEIDERLMNLRNTKCCVDFKNRKMIFINEKSLEKESCYDACEWTIEPDDYLLYIEGRKLEMTGDIEGAKNFLMPDQNCVIITETNIYIPCMLHTLAMEVQDDNNKKKEIYEKYKNSGSITKLYLQAIFRFGEEFDQCIVKYPFLKSILQHHYNVGLIWIIMRFEQEEMSNCLRNEINRYFDKQNFSDGMVFDFFKLLIEFNETIWYLDCFDDNEVNDIYNSLNILISSKLSLREKNELLKLVVQYGMSPYYLCYFFEKEQVDEKLLLAYKSLVSSINCLVVGNDESLKTKSGKIEESFKKIKEICGNNLITNACYHSIIEKYDSDAKETAEILLNRYSEYYYRRYIKILRAMLGFIAQNTIRKKSVIYIKNWLEKEDAQRDRLESYNLAEYELHKVLNDLENGDYNHKFENIHQVHNFLHQWALFEAPTVDIRELPNKLHDLVEFCNTFSMEKSKILRFESNLVEIELPMCTHKASFVINQTGFSVEFSESPETEDERIGRLVALDYIVERFFDEHYKIDHFYEKQLGSWKWLVYGKTIEEKDYYEKYKYFILIIRLLSDSSYDFSHKPIKKLGDINSHFCEPEWKFIMIHLQNYRKQINNTKIFTELKVFSLSDFFTQMSICESNREYFFHLYKSGFEESMHEFEKKNERLGVIKNSEEWIDEFRKLRLTILMLVSVWPKEVLNVIDEIDCKKVYTVLLAKNLFLRKDIQQIVSKELKIISEDLLLKCVPQLLVNKENFDKYIDVILQRKNDFRMAKQYLLYSRMQELDIEIIKKLISELYYVPSPQNKSSVDAYESSGVDYYLFDIDKTLTTQL